MHARTLAAISVLGLAHAALGQIYSNTTPITLPEFGQAAVYPSTINVSGTTAAAHSVSVVLHGLSHTYAADLDILLVAPNGLAAYIISDAGQGLHFTGGTYGFATHGAPIPLAGVDIPPAIYAPTFTSGDDSFPGVIYTLTHLSQLVTVWPDGQWRLYIIDDATGDSGAIAGGWSLVFNSDPSPTADNTYTYQGRLDGTSGPVNLRFTLHSTQWFPDSLSVVEGPRVVQDVMPDEHGLFTAEVPFSAGSLTGEPRFVEVAVRAAGQSDYTVLSPRQPITMAPMADWARKAENVPWGGIADMPAGLSDGVDDAGPWTVVAGGVQYTGGGNVGVGSTLSNAFNVTSSSMFNTRLHSTATPGTGLQLTNSNTTQSGLILLTGPADGGGAGNLIVRNVNAAFTYPGLVLTPANYLGINTDSPDFTLTVNGTAGKPGGGSWAVWSDARLKHDITPLAGTLDKLLNVHGVSYLYNEPEKIGERVGRQTGVVAQEVEKVFPEWVDEGAKGFKSVTFRGFEAMTIEAIRDLRAEKDAAAASAQAQINALIKENAELKARLDRLDAEVHAK